MEKTTQLLYRLGFSKSLVKIYLFLTQNKSATALEISRGTGVGRSGVYRACQDLIKMDLIEKKSGSSVYTSLDAKKLVEYVKKNRILIKSIIDNMTANFNLDFTSKMNIYKFPTNLSKKLTQKNEVDSALSGQTIREFGSYDIWHQYVYKEGGKNLLSKGLVEKRIENKVCCKLLVTKKDKIRFDEDTNYPQPTSGPEDLKNLRKVKTLPPTVSTEVDCIMTPNSIKIYGPPSEKYLFEICSPSISKAFQKIFDYFWINSY